MTKQNLSALSFYIAFFVLLFAGSRVITSGFHSVDDHEVFPTLDQFASIGYAKTVDIWISNDMNFRFRPFYYLLRKTQMYFFRDQAVFYYMYYMTMAILTSFFLFLFAKNAGFNRRLSFLFPFFVLLGSQAYIWCRLRPTEAPGIFFLSIALWLATLAVKTPGPLYKLLTLIFVILFSLCKESFIVFIPAFILIYIWLIHERKQQDLKTIILQNRIFIGLMSLVFLAEVFIIVKFIVPDGYTVVEGVKPDYAANIIAALQALLLDTDRDLRLNGNNYALYILILGGILWYLHKVQHKAAKLKSFFLELLPMIVIVCTIVGFQLAMYAKPGMSERYLIPAVFGMALPVIYLADRLLKSEHSKTAHLILFCMLGLTVVKSSAYTFKEFRNYAKEGVGFNKMLTEMRNHSQPSNAILFVSDRNENAELSNFMLRYFESDVINRKDIHLYFLTEGSRKGSGSGLGAGLMKKFDEKSFQQSDSLDYKVIAMPMEKEPLLVLKGTIPLKDYQRKTVEQKWVVYYK